MGFKFSFSLTPTALLTILLLCVCSQQIDDQFAVGDDLVVAPVMFEGDRTRRAYLPRGQWVEWGMTEVIDGHQWVTVDAPLDKLPLFVRAGSV